MKTKCLLLLLLGVGNAFAAEAPPPPVYPVTRTVAPPVAPAAEVVAAAPSFAPPTTPAPPPTAAVPRSTAELEQLVAPIALYPDPLIASILPAAVYPLEIVQAARFVANTNNLPKLDQQPWDENVKNVARLPAVIQLMNADLNWTVALGEAFLAQPLDLMNAMQTMRAKAQAAGKLQTTPQQVVTATNAVVERMYEGEVVYVTNTVIQVQPASSDVIYVPSYNPSVVYVDDDDDDAAAFVSFGVGITFGAIMANNCDWYYGGCYHGHYPPPPPHYPPPYYPPPGAPRPPPAGRPPGSKPPVTRPPTAATLPANQLGGATASTSQRWQPDQNRLNKSSGPATAQTSEARGWGSGAQTTSRPTASPGTRPISPGVTQPSVRQPSVQQPTVRQPSVQQPSVNRPAASVQSANRPAATPSVNRPSAQPSSAFSGVNSGARANNYSNRGATSRGGGSGGARGGGRR